MPKRVEVARNLKLYTDSILQDDGLANILITGDFNDTPVDSSLYNVLNAGFGFEDDTKGLINLMHDHHEDTGRGTLKYRENWEVYDQIIVSRASMALQYAELKLQGPYIYDADFLLIEDERYLGIKPFRTYLGPKYIDGFSDHLPVYVRFSPEK